MTVEHVEVLVEEPSMAAAMRFLLPKLLGAISFEVYQHQCKDELLIRLPERVRGYAHWLPPNWRVVVLVDRDNDDCRELKARLESIAHDAELTTRSTARQGVYSIVNRVVVEELESWYFGDWAAVQAAYPRVPATIPRQEPFRIPDAIAGGTWEAFERVLKKAGYFKGGLRKIEVARAIGAHLVPERNSSTSFRALRDALVEMAIP